MDQSNPYSGIMRMAEWFVRFTYINVLWFIFTLFGGIIFGVMPATSTMFSLFRKWFRGEDDFPVFMTFWKEYKAHFKISNFICLPLVAIGIFLYLDFLVLINLSHWISNPLLVILGMLGLAFLFIAINIFPVLSHFELSFKDYYKRAFLISLVQPFRLLFLIFTNILIALLIFTFPILFPILGISLFGAVNMGSFLIGFRKIEAKQQGLSVDTAKE
ncbi:YesL family protein [Salipaludibacillus sp. HK11]|uniref:YesL family protein n=1 Tax=Salipaludibacillus sp. HK11 TaxID=3394320 RepID=UPI0039FCA3F9